MFLVRKKKSGKEVRNCFVSEDILRRKNKAEEKPETAPSARVLSEATRSKRFRNCPDSQNILASS